MDLFKSFTTVGGATLASRLLGFVREILIASLIGAGPVADAFYAAFRFPNLFRRLFAEGAFNTAFVPLFAKELEAGGHAAAERFAREVFSVLLVTLLVLVALMEIFMPLLVATVIAPRFGTGTEKTLLTIDLARIMFPYLLCMSLVAMLSGVLNAFRHYFIAALVPVLLNVVMIAVLLACEALDTGNSALTGRVMAWGVALAGFAQLGLVWIAAKRTGFTLAFQRPRLTGPVKRVLVLAVPAAIAGGITQINLLIGQMIASGQDGAIALLQYADRIYQLPLGVIGIAIGVVLLPELARDLKSGNDQKAVTTQNHALEFAMFLTLPATAALMIMPGLISSVLYQRGAFDAVAANGVAGALAAFAVGLPAFVLIKVLSPGFFARENTRTPMNYAIINAVVNVVLSYILFQQFAHVGIAAATSIAAWANVAFLSIGLYRHGYWPFKPRAIRRCMMMLAASAIMALVLYGLMEYLADAGLLHGFVIRALALLSLVVIGGVIYLAACRLTGAVEFGQMIRSFRRRRHTAGE
ncbi:MAG: murein biosynthesis integral membrane protein MurJ [Rhizobiales bacterium]|nr:murein biosynthesis integral membrane protein MurJ [Hyphomicrobiales bacterium]